MIFPQKKGLGESEEVSDVTGRNGESKSIELSAAMASEMGIG
jgi:hypothetical protein